MDAKIEKLDNYGRGITYIDNKICFVKGALPNEEVEIKIINEKKKYLEAVAEHILVESKDRIQERCPYASICGGCQLGHMSFNMENDFKEKKVKEILKKYANIEESSIESIQYHKKDHYRNKITLHGKDGQLGYYQEETNTITPIKECLLVNHRINQIIHLLQEINQNIEEVIIKTSNDEKESMISIKGTIKDIDSLLKECTVVILNGKILSKKEQIITNIGNKKYYESILSFFQINNTLTKDLYDSVMMANKEQNYQTILDLYCGTGSIGIYVKQDNQSLMGIDNNPSNIEDANRNIELNQITNCSFICDKVENRIDQFKNIDCIIVDPPRAGLDPKTIKNIIRINPRKIIYVSCDIITLARDINILKEKYNILRIKPFNMFPRTYHCESIAVLERK